MGFWWFLLFLSQLGLLNRLVMSFLLHLSLLDFCLWMFVLVMSRFWMRLFLLSFLFNWFQVRHIFLFRLCLWFNFLKLFPFCLWFNFLKLFPFLLFPFAVLFSFNIWGECLYWRLFFFHFLYFWAYGLLLRFLYLFILSQLLFSLYRFSLGQFRQLLGNSLLLNRLFLFHLNHIVILLRQPFKLLKSLNLIQQGTGIVLFINKFFILELKILRIYQPWKRINFLYVIAHYDVNASPGVQEMSE